MTSIASITPKTGSHQGEQLKHAAQAFEAIFLRDMIGAMRKTSLGDDLFGNSGGLQFRDMMDDNIADNLAKTNGIGIAELLLSQWRNQP